MARASKVLPAPGLPTRSMLWTKDRTLFYRHFTELLNAIIRFSFGTIGFAMLSRTKMDDQFSPSAYVTASSSDIFFPPSYALANATSPIWARQAAMILSISACSRCGRISSSFLRELSAQPIRRAATFGIVRGNTKICHPFQGEDNHKVILGFHEFSCTFNKDIVCLTKFPLLHENDDPIGSDSKDNPCDDPTHLSC